MFKSYNFIYLGLTLLLFAGSAFTHDDTAAIKKMSQHADVIISGKVVEMQSNWNASKTRIYTKTKVQVDEFLKGNNPDNVVERQE